MVEIEPKIDGKSAFDINKKNLTREKNIKKETEKVKKLVDLIFKTNKKFTEKKENTQEVHSDKEKNKS